MNCVKRGRRKGGGGKAGTLDRVRGEKGGGEGGGREDTRKDSLPSLLSPISQIMKLEVCEGEGKSGKAEEERV